MLLPQPAPGSTTDAVFEAYQKDAVQGKPVGDDRHTPMWVPQNDDSLFVSVLRSMMLLKKEEPEAFKITVQRLKDAATRYGKTPLRLVWSVIKKMGTDASTPEIEDVRRLRAIVAAHVREHFVSYYKHHLSNYEEIWNAYGEGMLGWEPYDPESGMDEEVHKQETARWQERVQKLIDLDSTSAYIIDGLGTALRYWAEDNDECVAKCLQVLRGFYEEVAYTQHEIRDALVIAIETPYQDVPTLVLDALADLLGVHIDLYQQEQGEIGAAFSNEAVCVESYGPSRDNEEELKGLKAQYNQAGLYDFPLFDVLMMEYTQEQQMFYSYSIPDSMEVGAGKRTPALEQDNDDDAVLQFYAALQNDDPLEDLPTFVDPCVNQAALVGAQPMDDSQKPDDDDDDDDEDDGDDEDDNDDDPNDPDYDQAQGGDRDDDEADGHDDDENGEEEEEEEEEDEEEANALQNATATREPSVPIRLQPFAKTDYRMQGNDAPISKEQEEWAKQRMKKAHAHYVAHVSSRKGYGRIMLMQDSVGDPSASTSAPTGGEAAKSKELNRQSWMRLKASPLPQVVALTERIEEEYSIKLGEDISANRLLHKVYQDERNAAERGSEEWKDAAEWLDLFAKDKRKYEGLLMAVRLVANDKLPFAANEEGGWVAILAWWKLLHDAADQPGVREKAWNVDRDKGRWLCRTYSIINSEDKHKEDKPTRLWRGLWEFLNSLYGWSRDNSQPTFDAVARLASDATFAESVSWASLGYRVNLGS